MKAAWANLSLEVRNAQRVLGLLRQLLCALKLVLLANHQVWIMKTTFFHQNLQEANQYNKSRMVAMLFM